MKETVRINVARSLLVARRRKIIETRIYSNFTAILCKSFIINSAGEGNRTLVTVHHSVERAHLVSA